MEMGVLGHGASGREAPLARCFLGTVDGPGSNTVALCPARERTERHRHVEGIAAGERLRGRLANPIEHGLGYRSMDEQPGSRDADLAAIGEGRGGDRRPQMRDPGGIGEDELRGFAAALAHARLAVGLTGGNPDAPPPAGHKSGERLVWEREGRIVSLSEATGKLKK